MKTIDTTSAPAPAPASRAMETAVGLLLLVAAVAYFAALAPYGLELADEGHLVHQIYRTYLGQLPYVEFHTGYAPGVYYLNAFLFSLFGVNLLALRLCLAVVNGATVFCLYVLARRIGASVPAAAMAGALYLGLIPFHDGHFAPFNIPYPAWYVTLFWLASALALVRWWRTGSGVLWLLAGVCAGVVFTFKQNSGLLNLAGLGITLGLVERPMSDATSTAGAFGRLLRRIEGWLPWLLPLGGAVALTVMMRSAGSREGQLFALPLLSVVIWQVVPRARLARPVPALTLWRDGVLLTAGFAVVTLPWAVYFWPRLGRALFLRSILYIGAGYEQYYFIGYPQLGPWGVNIAGAFVVVLAIGLLMRRRWLPAPVVIAATLLGGLLASVWLVRHPPPMVEGFQKSVVMRVMDIAFPVVLFIEWAAIAALVVSTVRRWRAHEPAPSDHDAESAPPALATGPMVIVLISAVLMHAQLYPRSDFMHLIYAAPGLLVVGARLLDALAGLWGRGLTRARGGQRAVEVAMIAPVYALALILMAPALARIEYLARSGWGADGEAVVRLDSPRAPLLLEPGAGRLFLGLSATVRYVQAHARPDEFVFTFPCLDIVSFLADRRDPSRHGYYYPGSPGHSVEAEVIDALRVRSPRYIVALHDHALFFVGAPLYYFNLHQYVTEHYTLERRLGMFDVLRFDERRATRARRVATGPAGLGWGGDGEPATRSDDQNENDLADAMALWRRELQHQGGDSARRLDATLGGLPEASVEALAAVVRLLELQDQYPMAELVQESRSSAGAAALAVAMESPGLAPNVSDRFIRVISAVADLRAVPSLLQALSVDPAHRDALAGALFNVMSRSWIEHYWYAPSERSEWSQIEKVLPTEQLIQWIDDPWESLALRSVAIRVAGNRRTRTLIPFLARLVGDPNEHPQLRVDAAHSLVDLGFGKEIFPSIGALLRQGDLVSAVLTVALYPQAPETGRELVAESMTTRNDGARAQAFWLAAGISDPKLAADLRAGLTDSLPEVRMAAAWGLGNIGDASGLPALQQVASDHNDEVEAFVARAIARIGAPEP